MARHTSKPFLGTTTDVNEAFPGIDEIDVTITQDPYGYYLRNDWQRTSRFSKSTMKRHLACVNPRCQQGGLDLQQIVLFHADGKYEFSCNGHEGTPAGRRIGNACDNRFSVELTVRKRPVSG
jgi:hypothetical protein